MNDCIWAFIFQCGDKCRCDRYISANSEEGQRLLKSYEKDVEIALNPVKDYWWNEREARY